MGDRMHLIGIDKETSSPLRSATNPLLVLRQQASTHERDRIDSVAETMSLIGVLTAKKILSGREVVTVGGAIFQWGSGVRTDRTVAAHCLPGHLRFNSHPIHTDPEWSDQQLQGRGVKPLAMSSKLRNLSARTNVVDTLVNEVDSLIERMGGDRGLKPLFGRSVHRMMEKFIHERPDTWSDMGELVRDAIDHYRLAAGFVCEERMDYLGDRNARLPLGSPPSAEEALQQKQAIADEYLQIVQDGAFVPPSMTDTGFRWVIRDVLQEEDQVFSNDGV